MRRSKALILLSERLGRIGAGIIAVLFNFESQNPTATKDVLKAQREIDAKFFKMKEAFSAFIFSELPKIYKNKSEQISKQLKRFDKIGPSYQNKAVKILQDQTILDFFDGVDEGSKDLRRFLRLTQQKNISEAKINEAINRGLVKGTPKAIKNELLTVMEGKLKDGKIITVSKNGLKRRYNPEAYAEMVARTRLAEAQSHSTINTCIEHGVNYVRVTDHGDTDPHCNAYAGRVFSISGQSDITGVAPLTQDAIPPYHPSCIHRLTPWIPGKESGIRRERKIKQVEEANQIAEKRVLTDKNVKLRKAKDAAKKAEVARLREENRIERNRMARERRLKRREQ